jgi:hypothetical protein
LSSAATITINLTSIEIDPVLALFDETTGAQLAFNDDANPPGLDARIVQSLAAGTYFIVATSFGADETGAYTLAVNLTYHCASSTTPVEA